jgi:hypothetical protein
VLIYPSVFRIVARIGLWRKNSKLFSPAKYDILTLHRERFRQALNPPTDEGLTRVDLYTVVTVHADWMRATVAKRGSPLSTRRFTLTTPLTKAKNDFKEAVSAHLHEGLTADEIHALVNDVIKKGL